MKKYLIILAVATSSLLLSCNDKLDLPNDGRISLDEVFTDRNMTRGYLNSCYTGILYYPSYLQAIYTDESQDGDAAAVSSSASSRWYDGNNSAITYWGLYNDNYGGISGPWSSYYQGIRRCNLFLNRIDNITFSATQDEIEGWKGQAYTLRALYYLELVRLYGSVPLITEEMASDHDFSQDTRASFGTIIRQVIDDCRMALSMSSNENYGFAWVIKDPNDSAKMWRAVAYGIMSRAATYAVSPKWNDNTISKDEATSITKEALDQCLRNGLELYRTAPDPEVAQDAYAAFHLRLPDPERTVDKESIIHQGGRYAVWRDSGLPTTSGQTKSGVCPTQELVDAFEMANGEAPITGYSDAQHLQPIVNPSAGYRPYSPYEDRDPRFYSIIYFNGALRKLDGSTDVVETFVGGNEGISNRSRKYTRTGYYLRKFNGWQSDKDNNNDGSLRYMRLAELYLNFAECAYQSAGPYASVASTVGGSAMSAADAINAVRDRAGMPAFPTGLSVSDFEKKYRNERRIELCFEGHRYFDVRRWDILAETERYVTGVTPRRSGASFTYQRFSFQRETYSDKYYWHPVPQSEAVKMQELTGANWQNPGWSQ